MAKSVADLIVDLKIDGIEGVNQLKSAFRGLSKAAGPADKGLEQIRRSVTAFAKAGQLSRQSIAGQIEAFKGLRQQATIGSSVYRKLGKDIDGLTQSLDRLNKKEDESSKKPRSPKQIFGEGIAVVPEKFSKQIAAGNQILQSLKVTSQEYGKQLANVTVRTQEFTRAQQRQQVVAANLVAANRAQTTGFLQSSRVNIESTDTISALKQKISELSQDVENLDVGSQSYTTTSRQLKDAQEELNQVLGVSSKAFDDLARAQERSERRAQKITGMQSARAGAIGTRDPRTGAMIAGGAGAPASLVQQPVREISSLYQSIGNVGMSKISADIDRMGKSYGEVANDIKKATLASNGSIRSLEAQRNSWASLRAGLNPASKSYREVGREIDKVDKRLAKLNKRRGFSAKGAAQTVGAVASAGIFGGPLGAAGALGGAAIGGAAGAAVGGGIGASVGILAQQVSGFTDYAASINLAEKALKRLITVEGESAKARMETAKNEAVANQVIEYAVAKLNVERADATIGMTRLSAAVLGAGGNIETAGLAFLGATKAIKATKGSAEDVRGGLTALVQMFSKGKISAEELSGQLGERFPAAVTAFAKANGISTQELQKMLKNGEVGLDKLVNFLQFAVKKYSDGALEMAASSEESGQRQTIAFQEVRRQLGEQLVSVGSELQQSITKALKDLTPAIVNIAKASAKAIKAIIDGIALLITHFDKIKDVIIILVGGAVGGKALGLIVKISASIIPLVKKVGLLQAAILFLNRALMLNPFYALAAGITAAGVAIDNHINRHDRFIDSVARGSTSVDNAKKKLTEYGKEAASINTKLNSLPVPKAPQRPTAAGIGIAGTQSMSDLSGGQSIGEMQIPQMPADTFAADRAKLQARLVEINKARTGLAKAISDRVELESLPASMQDLLKQLMEGSTIPGLDTDPSGGGTGKTRKDISDLALKAGLADLATKEKGFALDASGIALQKEKLHLQLAATVQSTAEMQDNEQILAVATARQTLMNGLFDLNEKVKRQAEEDLKKEQEKAAALNEIKLITGEITQEEFDQEEIRQRATELVKLFPGQFEAVHAALVEAASPLGKFKDGLEEVFESAMDLNTALGEAGIQAVNSFGDAFADFVATGKASFAEMTSSILQDLARIFAKAALFKGLSLIPGVGSFLGLAKGGVTKGMTPPTTIPGGVGAMAANGLAVARNGIVPYAKGGLVTKPTLFQYAQGGVGNYGLMGEAGTEAIMPLRRGSNGKLGVESSGGGASNVVINVDASGSNVQGDQPNAKALGAAIGAAVQAELVKQKRPGGLLS